MASPYMLLNLPAPSVTPGPEWAQELIDALNVVDAHDHTSGFGARVPAAGLNINADLPFGGNNATVLRTARFQNLGEAPALATDVGCIAVAGGDLYYVNGNGQAIQITAGPNINLASIGAIGGDYSTSTASEVYIAATTTFEFFSATNKYANLDGASIVIREPGATSPKGITLKSPANLANDYSFTFPAALPNATLPLVGASNGVLSFSKLVAAQIDPSAGILGSQLAGNAAIRGSQLAANAGITGSQLAAAAGIVGTQLADNAGILATQLAGGLTNAEQTFGTPVNPTDVAIKSYVDGLVAVGPIDFGARINGSNAAVIRSFNRTGAAFTVSHTGTGRYRISHASLTVNSFFTPLMGGADVTYNAGSMDVYFALQDGGGEPIDPTEFRFWVMI